MKNNFKGKPMSQLICLIVCFIPCWTYAQISLKKTEELRINSIARIDLIDYFDSKKIYLGFMYSQEGGQVVLLNDKGKIIVKKVLVGDGPNQSASNINCLAFSKEGDILIQSPTQVIRFDQSLTLKKKISYTSKVNMLIYGRKEYFAHFDLNDVSLGFSFLTIPTGTNSYSGRAEHDEFLLEVFHERTGTLSPIAAAGDRSIYNRLSNKLISSLYFNVYAIDRDKRKIFVTTKFDDEITVYDLATRKLDYVVKVNHEQFRLLKQTIISQSDLPSYGEISLGPINNKLVSLGGGLFVLDYVREISRRNFEEKKSLDRTYHHFQDPDFHRLIFFDATKQLSGDIPLPKNGKLMIALPGNRLLFKIENPEVEEDFVRYEIYEVVKN